MEYKLTQNVKTWRFLKKKKKSQAVVAQAFNPSTTWEAEAGGFLSSRPAWSTKRDRTARAIQRNLSRKAKKKKKELCVKRKSH